MDVSTVPAAGLEGVSWLTSFEEFVLDLAGDGVKSDTVRWVGEVGERLGGGRWEMVSSLSPCVPSLQLPGVADTY